MLPAGGEVLESGRLVEVRWQGLADDVDELELLLLVGDGEPVALRLTDQLDGSTRSFLWRVPSLPACRARLRLRWGRDGVETEVEPSAPFAILSGTAAPHDRVCFREGELWVCRSDSGAEPVLDRDGRVTESGAGRGLSAVVESSPESAPDLVGSRRHGLADNRRRAVVAAVADPETSAHRPLTIPLRP